MIETEYKKQLVYLPKTHALSLLRFAEARSIPSLPKEILPEHEQLSEPVRFACGQLSNLIWECWENAKQEFKYSKDLDWQPNSRRRTPFITLEGKVLRAKYFTKDCQETLEEAPSLEGHLSNTLELRLAFPEDTWEEMRSLHLAEERSFSSFLVQLLEMYDYKIKKSNKQVALSGVLGGKEEEE